MDLVDDELVVWGLELRYVLTWYLVEAGGVLSVGDLVRRLRSDGLAVTGQANKVVADALRWEVGKGRAVRVARGRYRRGVMPRQTKSRIRKRVAALRRVAAARRSERLMASPRPTAA
jgi:hypothetical protein